MDCAWLGLPMPHSTSSPPTSPPPTSTGTKCLILSNSILSYLIQPRPWNTSVPVERIMGHILLHRRHIFPHHFFFDLFSWQTSRVAFWNLSRRTQYPHLTFFYIKSFEHYMQYLQGHTLLIYLFIHLFSITDLPMIRDICDCQFYFPGDSWVY